LAELDELWDSYFLGLLDGPALLRRRSILTSGAMASSSCLAPDIMAAP
jgi:hypothetical protein